jgi:hypothetical protein
VRRSRLTSTAERTPPWTLAIPSPQAIPGVGLDRKSFEEWQDCLQRGVALRADFDTKGLTPPFEVRDREEDMRVAYAFFAERLGH